MSEFEEAHYEVDEMWLDEAFGENDHRRIRETIELIPDYIINSVLDVGCGNGMFLKRLAEMRPKIEQLHGVDRSDAALALVGVQKTRANISALPFCDRSFDLVTSLQVLEHLPVEVFQRAIEELARVARKFLIISVPLEEDLEGHLIQCPFCRSRVSPYLHMRSFSVNDVKRIFDAHGFKSLKEREIGQSRFLYGWTAFRRRFPFGSGAANPYRHDIPCPVCGGMIAGRRSSSNTDNRNVLSPFARARETVKNLWPACKKPAKIAVLFSRKDL